jgi:hypothetical protein
VSRTSSLSVLQLVRDRSIHGELRIQVVLLQERGGLQGAGEGGGNDEPRGGAPVDAAARGAARPAGHRADARQRVPRAGGRRQGGGGHRRRGRRRRRRPDHPRRVRGRAVGVVAGDGSE